MQQVVYFCLKVLKGKTNYNNNLYSVVCEDTKTTVENGITKIISRRYEVCKNGRSCEQILGAVKKLQKFIFEVNISIPTAKNYILYNIINEL